MRLRNISVLRYLYLFPTYSCLKLLRILTNQQKASMADATLIVANVNARHCRAFCWEGVRELETAEILVAKLLGWITASYLV